MPKLAERLTDAKIRNAKPKEKPYKLAASRSLHLLVKPMVQSIGNLGLMVKKTPLQLGVIPKYH